MERKPFYAIFEASEPELIGVWGFELCVFFLNISGASPWFEGETAGVLIFVASAAARPFCLIAAVKLIINIIMDVPTRVFSAAVRLFDIKH